MERYYVQQWLLNGACLMAISALLSLWLEAGTTAMPVRATVIAMGLTWVLVGGVGFAVTSATNSDATVLVFGYVVTAVLHGVFTGGGGL